MKDNTDHKYQYDEAIDDEVNLIIQKGSVYLIVFTTITTGLLIGASLFGVVNNVILPTSASLFALLYSIAFYYLSRNNLIRGKRKIYVILPLMIFPFYMFIASHYAVDYGTATYINAPIVFVYFLVLILTGYIFDLKLTILLGAVYSVEFYLSYLLGKNNIALIDVPDPLMKQTLTSPHIYIIKAILIMLGAILVGFIAVNSKKLINKVVRKEMEKESIDKILGQYVSPSVKSRIIGETSEAKGNRKNAAILLADIRSFTSYVESHNVNEVVSQMNEYFSRMIDCIERNNGIVHNFVGDCIMAAFGSLIDIERPCDSAFNASKEMLKELKLQNKIWTGAGRVPFEIGIGMHYGEITLGAVGSVTRKEYAVIGDIVNTASRMESLTKESKYSVICSKTFYEKLTDENMLKFDCIGETRIKGKKEEVTIYGHHSKTPKNHV